MGFELQPVIEVKIKRARAKRNCNRADEDETEGAENTIGFNELLKIDPLQVPKQVGVSLP